MIICIVLLCVLVSCSESKKQREPAAASETPIAVVSAKEEAETIVGWHTLEQKVLVGDITQEEARKKFGYYDSLLAASYPKYRMGSTKRVFPLVGYSSDDIGGKNGEGYRPGGYNWFDGNRHGGHPAQDIFVKDVNQDGIEDGTNHSIKVVSVCRGIVVSLRSGWTVGSDIRGGNYIYVYDPWQHGYYYYAHLDSILAIIGDTVAAGQQIATLGRSGKNAYPKRSPTHLHLMGLSATSTGPVPKNLYNELCESSRRNQSPHCPFQDVVDIATLSQEIVVDLKYSQEDNFVGEDLYGDLDVCYLREKPARMLVEAQRLLSEMKPGYLLVVYDCLRPRSVQRKMWNRVKGTPHQKYVADPDRISMHNYGAAVDVSIIDNEGHLLDMGSPFDFFGEISQPRFEEKLLEEGAITATHYRNRHLLRNLMEKAGFKSIGSEWWHFNAGDKKRIRQDYTVVE